MIFFSIDKDSTFINLTANPCFLDRRSNLHGMSLKAMASIQPPYFWYDPNLWYSKEGWSITTSGDQVKDITKDPEKRGLFYDVLKLLEYEMNFTTSILIRRCET